MWGGDHHRGVNDAPLVVGLLGIHPGHGAADQDFDHSVLPFRNDRLRYWPFLPVSWDNLPTSRVLLRISHEHCLTTVDVDQPLRTSKGLPRSLGTVWPCLVRGSVRGSVSRPRPSRGYRWHRHTGHNPVGDGADPLDGHGD